MLMYAAFIGHTFPHKNGMSGFRFRKSCEQWLCEQAKQKLHFVSGKRGMYAIENPKYYYKVYKVPEYFITEQ